MIMKELLTHIFMLPCLILYGISLVFMENPERKIGVVCGLSCLTYVLAVTFYHCSWGLSTKRFGSVSICQPPRGQQVKLLPSGRWYRTMISML